MAESTEERDRREREAYADEAMTQANAAWQQRVAHIGQGPTTQRGWETAFSLISAKLGAGSRALDVGCGPGYYSKKVKELGASYVLGYDISEHYVARARQAFGVPGELEFRVHSAHDPVEGTFDVVCGFAVLHHLDFRSFLLDAYERNLAPGGRMLFWEPMSHPVILAFHRFVRSAHSADEWPLMPKDLRWLRDTFGDVLVRPVNLAAMFTNAASSFVFSAPDNPLSRLGDRIDRSVERRPRLAPFGQMGIIVIDKPLVAHGVARGS
ncbi:MAG: toxoflavin synthase [bacterium]|jgi:SAM-dependent methyltransferase